MAQDNFVAPTIQPSGTTWAQFKTGGVGILLTNLAAANPVKANPTTQATVSVSGSGGLLPAGTYYCQYSFVDPFGETLAGGESAQFTVTAGQVPTVTLPALPTGVQAINLYLTLAGGGPGTETAVRHRHHHHDVRSAPLDSRPTSRTSRFPTGTQRAGLPVRTCWPLRPTPRSPSSLTSRSSRSF